VFRLRRLGIIKQYKGKHLKIQMANDRIKKILSTVDIQTVLHRKEQFLNQWHLK